MPGIGKSSIGYQYARSEISNYKGGCWVIDVNKKFNDADNKESSHFKAGVDQDNSAIYETEYENIIIGLMDTLSSAQILSFKEQEKLHLKLAKQKIKDHFDNIILNDTENKVLFVFDNVKNPNKFERTRISDFLPNDAHIIVTSHRSETKHTEHIICKRVDELNSDEARQLLRNHYAWTESDEQIIIEILNRIGKSPLGISLIGAFMKNRNSDNLKNNITYNEILKDIKTNGIEIFSDEALFTENDKDKSRHYNKVYSWILDKIKDDLEPHEKMALNLASVLKIETIPLKWIENVLKKADSNLFTRTAASLPSKWDNSIQKLISFSIWGNDIDPENFRMHLILQNIIYRKSIKDNVEVEYLEHMSESLRNQVEKIFDELDYEHNGNQLNSFYNLILNRDSTISDFIIPINKILILLMNTGQYTKANNIIDKALDYFHNQPPSETELILSTCYNFRAQIRAQQSKYSEARKYYLMAIGTSLHSKEHKNDVFMHSVSLADMESAALVNRGESIVNYSFVNKIKIFGKKYRTENDANHLRVIAINLKNEAMEYVEQNKYSTNLSFHKDNLLEALNCIKKSISIVKEDSYSKDLEYQFRIDLCRILRQMDNFDKAIFELEKAKNLIMAINETNSIMYMYYLEKALILKEQMYFEEALKSCEEARLLVEKEFGNESDQYTKCLVVGNEINLLAHLKNKVEFGQKIFGTTTVSENMHNLEDLKGSEKKKGLWSKLFGNNRN